MTKNRTRASYFSGSPMTVPDGARKIGVYGGFDLMLKYASRAEYSDRSMAYIFALQEGDRDAAFTQISTVHSSVIEDRSASEVERRLSVDVISRAKIRIKEGDYERGQIYTMEITDLWEDQVGRVNLPSSTPSDGTTRKEP